MVHDTVTLCCLFKEVSRDCLGLRTIIRIVKGLFGHIRAWYKGAVRKFLWALCMPHFALSIKCIFLICDSMLAYCGMMEC